MTEHLQSVLQFIEAAKENPDLLHKDVCAPVRDFIESFGGVVPGPAVKTSPPEQDAVGGAAAAAAEEEEDDPERMKPETEALPPMPSGSGEDYEKAGEHKQKASDAKGAGDFALAVEEYTAALLAQASALTFANRGDCLLKMKRPVAAVADCDAALGINPDSAKALKIKGDEQWSVVAWVGRVIVGDRQGT